MKDAGGLTRQTDTDRAADLSNTRPISLSSSPRARPRRRRRPGITRTGVVVLGTALALVAAACDSGSADSETSDQRSDSGTETSLKDAQPDITEKADFVVGGSVRELWVTDAEVGSELSLVDGDDELVETKTVDELGSVIFRYVEPGEGYTVRAVEGDDVFGSDEVTVTSEDDVPAEELYDQELKEGLNYVRVRDGVELAMTVRLPPGVTMDDAPFPTVIEYSGYPVAAPGNLLDAILAGKLDDPLLPSVTGAVGAVVAPALGFATVSVQMRGSGCSGGSYDLFGYPTIFDGYDAIETVARQPWVKGGKVGMVGISFSGNSQLFTAGTRPPHLAAVAPLSVLDDHFAGIGYPGGILNDGFALEWLTERVVESTPAPEKGSQKWAAELVRQGDQHCIDNQKLRLQTEAVDETVKQNPYRRPEVVDHRAPANWIGKIDVPVFLAGAFQDEQTGPRFPYMIESLAKNPDVYVNLYNGFHTDSLGPAMFSRWLEFLQIFVADQVPATPGFVGMLAPTLYQELAKDSKAAPVPEIRFTDAESAEAAKESFRAETPRVRVLMEVGGDPEAPGSLRYPWEITGDSWPLADIEPTRLSLGADGTLVEKPDEDESEVTYTGDESARPEGPIKKGGKGIDNPLPDWDWTPIPAENGAGFVSEALAEDLVVVGPMSADLVISSDAPDVDLQVTVSEVRPDGQERYIQNGWLRASHRALDDDLTSELRPAYTHLEENAEELEPGVLTPARVEVYPFAYAFRKGSKIRVAISAPGGDRVVWRFDTIEQGDHPTTIHLGGDDGSSVLLPVLPGVTVPTPLPLCASLRGQPCRTYTPQANGG